MTTTQDGLRALIVDDDEMSRDVAAAMFKRLGASEVILAETGSAALRWADTDRGRLDVVMCDLRMPEIDGLETLEGLASRTYPRMFVLASGADPRILRAATSAASRVGADRLRVVSKPLTIEDVQGIFDELSSTRAAPEALMSLALASPADCSTDMVKGLLRGEFIPFFQPRLDVGTHRLAAIQALFRWRHPRYRILGPDVFMQVAEAINSLHEIFFAVFRKVAMTCQAWHQQGHLVGAAINVPGSMLGSRDLPRRLEEIVALFGLEPHFITLEVDAKTWLHDQQLAREVLTRLRLRGFGLAIGSFGTGSSTIKQLTDAPFSEMNIDPSYLSGADNDEELAIAFSSYVSVARQLGMNVVADGVDTADHESVAAAFGCSQMQGALIGLPMDDETLLQWLDTVPAAAVDAI